MAEIKVEKKKPIWPWILIGLGILLLLFFVFRNNDQDQRGAAESENIIDSREDNDAVASYVAYVKDNSGRMGEDHEYTNEAFMKLIDAVESKADEINFEIQADINRAKEQAQSITNESSDTSHANSIRNSADILANALENMQNAKYPGLKNEASELRNAASSIKPDVLTLNQKDAVKNYLTSAADLLNKMNNN
jgi:uncharacterized protein Yka (UPF0111/DUF47 family)